MNVDFNQHLLLRPSQQDQAVQVKATANGNTFSSSISKVLQSGVKKILEIWKEVAPSFLKSNPNPNINQNEAGYKAVKMDPKQQNPHVIKVFIKQTAPNGNAQFVQLHPVAPHVHAPQHMQFPPQNGVPNPQVFAMRAPQPRVAVVEHGFIDGGVATARLSNQPPGTFLVRDSTTQPGAKVIGFVNQQGRVEHLRLNFDHQTQRYVGNVHGNNFLFASVNDVLQFPGLSGKFINPLNPAIFAQVPPEPQMHQPGGPPPLQNPNVGAEMHVNAVPQKETLSQVKEKLAKVQYTGKSDPNSIKEALKKPGDFLIVYDSKNDVYELHSRSDNSGVINKRIFALDETRGGVQITKLDPSNLVNMGSVDSLEAYLKTPKYNLQTVVTQPPVAPPVPKPVAPQRPPIHQEVKAADVSQSRLESLAAKKDDLSRDEQLELIGKLKHELTKLNAAGKIPPGESFTRLMDTIKAAEKLIANGPEGMLQEIEEKEALVKEGKMSVKPEFEDFVRNLIFSKLQLPTHPELNDLKPILKDFGPLMINGLMVAVQLGRVDSFVKAGFGGECLEARSKAAMDWIELNTITAESRPFTPDTQMQDRFGIIGEGVQSFQDKAAREFYNANLKAKYEGNFTKQDGKIVDIGRKMSFADKEWETFKQDVILQHPDFFKNFYTQDKFTEYLTNEIEQLPGKSIKGRDGELIDKSTLKGRLEEYNNMVGDSFDPPTITDQLKLADHKSIDSNTSIERLKYHLPGTYLVRASQSNADAKVITYVSNNGQVKELKITKNASSNKFEIEGGKSYNSFEEVFQALATKYNLVVPLRVQ